MFFTVLLYLIIALNHKELVFFICFFCFTLRYCLAWLKYNGILCINSPSTLKGENKRKNKSQLNGTINATRICAIYLQCMSLPASAVGVLVYEPASVSGRRPGV